MRQFLLAATALASLILAQPASAALLIKANGTTVATDPTNTFATYSSSIDGFNINVLFTSGVNAFGGNGKLMDNGSINISTQGSGTLTIEMTQTDIDVGTGNAGFRTVFTGIITNATVTRSFYLDAANTGAAATLLGSTTVGNAEFSTILPVSGPFSLTEIISITATGRGATLSSDDAVFVPEPMSLALMGMGLLGLAAVRRRRA